MHSCFFKVVMVTPQEPGSVGSGVRARLGVAAVWGRQWMRQAASARLCTATTAAATAPAALMVGLRTAYEGVIEKDQLQRATMFVSHSSLILCTSRGNPSHHQQLCRPIFNYSIILLW